MNDTFPETGATANRTRLWIYADGIDRAFKRATDAGCQVSMPPADMSWGDRMGKVTDRWGNEWTFAQHIKDLTPEELKKAQDEFIAQMRAKK